MTIPPKPWPTGLAEQCEPLVRRVLAPNASPYTFTGTQTYLVGHAGGLAVMGAWYFGRRELGLPAE